MSGRLSLELRARERMDEPLVVRWALSRLQTLVDARSEARVGFEERVFTDAALESLLQMGNPDLLPSLLRLVRVERFRSFAELIAHRWPNWDDCTAGWAAPVLATISADRALSVFETWWEHAARACDLDRLHGVTRALDLLAPRRGRHLAESLVERVVRAPEKSMEAMLLVDAFGLARAHGLASWREILRPYLSAGDLHKLGAFFGKLARRLPIRLDAAAAGGLSEASVQSSPWLFVEGTPLDDIVRMLRPSSGVRLEDLFSLLRSAPSPEVGGVLRPVVEVLQELQRTDGHLPRETTRFVVALLLDDLVVTRLQTDDLDCRQLLERVAIDLAGHPFLSELAVAMARAPRGEVLVALRESLGEHADSLAELHLARLMGELAWPETVPELIELTRDEKGDLVVEEATHALIRIGRPAVGAILERWETLDSSQKIYLGSAAAEIGGEGVVEHLVAHFPAMRNSRIEEWCRWAECEPDPRLLEVLAKEVHRCHPSIDTTFATLAALLEAEVPGLAEARERLRKDDRRRRELREFGMLGRPSAGGATIHLGLECPKCGDTNYYDVKKVFVDPDLQDVAPFVADELTCLSCGLASDLRLRGAGHLALMAEIVKVKVARDLKRPYSSPVQIVRMMIEGGRRVGPAEAIAHYEALIERSPVLAEAWLGLGNCLANVGRGQRAEGCFQRCLELEPACVEASLRLGEYLAKQGRRREAYGVLREAHRLRRRWVIYRFGQTPLAEIERSVLEGLEVLRPELASEDPPYLVPAAPRASGKVGRNAPCICNSGKKYKKCCGRP